MGKQRKRPPDDDRLSTIEQQLRATNQQLRASQQQLKTANQQLEAGNQQLRASEEELRKVNQDLRKRVKELDCLYGLSQLVERPDIVLDEIFQGLVELIPNGWRYPEITCARVIFEGKHFKTPNFKETKWRQLADIELLGKKAGILEVYYLKKKSELDEGPFLNEERELLNGLAERLGRIAQRIKDEQALKAAHQQLRADEQQLKVANQQLHANGQQLKAANQQLRANEQQLRAANQQLAANEAELRETRDYLESLINYANAPIIVWDAKFIISRFNRAFEHLMGYTADEVVGRKLSILFPEASREESLSKIARTLRGECWESIEIPVLCKDGDIRVALWNSANIYAKDGTTLLATIAQGQDITQRKKMDQALRATNEQLQASEQQLIAANEQLRASEQQLKAANQQLRANEQQLRAANQQLQAEVRERKKTEEKIKTTLKEKEVLLKEIHHRVRNNMQLISSILNIQSKHLRDEQALKMFKNGQSRIRSMALVHEKLYESKNLAGIDFAEYIRSITTYLFTLYKISEAVRLNVDIKDILLDINTAIPCALIVNEIVSNSLKYAFPEGIEGEIYIGLRSDKPDKFILIVKDNGIGFPKELDFRKTESLGMQLIIMLAGQLEGTVELDKSKGTAFTITFGKIKT
jgi:PAS domain S-box-containing protein